MLAAVSLALVGCGMTPREIKNHPTKTFESNKTQSEFVTCLVPRFDERTFNGMPINSVTKPLSGGVELSTIPSIEFTDITTKNGKLNIIYYGEATKRPPFMKYTRINEATEDIESCL